MLFSLLFSFFFPIGSVHYIYNLISPPSPAPGFTKKDLNSLPDGIAVPVKDAILHCWQKPSGLWSKEMFNLIGDYKDKIFY